MPDTFSLKSKNARLTFNKNNGGFRGIGLAGRSFNFSQDFLWQIILSDIADSEKKQITACNTDETNAFTYNILGNKTILEWKPRGLLSGLKIAVTVKLQDELSYWTIDIENNTSFCVNEVAFPYIRGIGKIHKDSSEDYLALPWQWGQSVRNPIDFISREELGYSFWDGKERNVHQLAYEYPGMYSMQFLAYGHPESKGLYFGIHDGEANYKRFGFYGRKDCKDVDYILKNYPEDLLEAGKNYKMPYPAVISVFDGNWMNACKIYKRWALAQKWCSAGKIKQRKDIPQWVKNIGLWYWNWIYWNRKGEPDSIAQALSDLKKRMAVPLAFHWYGWNNHAVDTSYPEYDLTEFAKKRLTNALREFKKEEIKVIPYTNGRLWNVDTESWQKENASLYACQTSIADPDKRTYYIEPYMERPFVAMCPFTKFWQDKVIENTRSILEYGVDGIYIDQVSSSYAVLCYAKNHGHKTGGNYWYTGYRTMMERLRKKLRRKYPNAAFTSESVLECFIDGFDAFLGYQCAKNYSRRFGPDSLSLPLFSNVYHGYIPVYGTGTTIEEEDSFYCGFALEACSGVRPSIQGYFRENMNNDAVAPKLQYIEEWVKKYYKVHEELAGAEMLPVKTSNMKNVKIKSDGNEWKTVPAILISAWKTADGNILVVAANHTGETQEGIFDMSSEEYSFCRHYDLENVDKDGIHMLQKNRIDADLHFKLMAHTIKLYKLNKT